MTNLRYIYLDHNPFPPVSANTFFNEILPVRLESREVSSVAVIGAGQHHAVPEFGQLQCRQLQHLGTVRPIPAQLADCLVRTRCRLR